MTGARLKIDQLLLFFLLSIGLLLLVFGKELIAGNSALSPVIKKYFDSETAIAFPPQGESAVPGLVDAFDPQVQIAYSVDGGSTFITGENELPIAEIKNPSLLQYPTSHYWRPPYGEFPSCKNVVVKLTNTSTGTITENKVLTWFSDASPVLPVVAVTMPSEDLFSEARGLMTFGSRSWSDSLFYRPWWFRPANFHGRGTGWERAGYFQYFEKGQLMTEQACGFRISGNATRGFPQKSLQVLAKPRYGKDKFEFPFFGEDGLKKYRSLVLRNSGNDNTKTLFADLLMQRLAADANVLTQQGSPVVVFINGNYWGIYNLQERVDEYYIAKAEDVKEEEVTILEGAYGELKDGDDDVKKEFDEIMEEIRASGTISDKKMNKIEESVNCNSFIDYVIFETFYGNGDWPDNNSMWYKAGDNKWKWILNDLDYGMAYKGAGNVNANLFDKLAAGGGVTQDLFNALMTNENFSERFSERAAEIMESCFNEKRVDELYTAVKNRYKADIETHIRRWRMIDSVEEWEANCAANRKFLTDRKAIYLKQVEELK